MRRLRRAAAAIVEFLIGDDPLGAALVLVAVCLALLLVQLGVNAWPLVPALALLALGIGVRSGARR